MEVATILLLGSLLRLEPMLAYGGYSLLVAGLLIFLIWLMELGLVPWRSFASRQSLALWLVRNSWCRFYLLSYLCFRSRFGRRNWGKNCLHYLFNNHNFCGFARHYFHSVNELVRAQIKPKVPDLI